MFSNKFNKRVNEIHNYINETPTNSYTLYHNTFYAALDAAIDHAKKKGYTIDEEDWFKHVTVGRGRPKDGETFTTNIGLEKNGKAVRQMLHIQIYNREEHYKTYELNCYIS